MVVTGLGVVTPLGHQLDVFWNNLVARQCGIDRITAFDATPFDTQVAGEVKKFDPLPAFPSPKEVRTVIRNSAFLPGTRCCSIPDSTSTIVIVTNWSPRSPSTSLDWFHITMRVTVLEQ